MRRTSVYPTQTTGLGSYVLALAGSGRDPLKDRTVQQGLLWLRLFFRAVFSALDMPPGTREEGWDWDFKYDVSPGDLGYNCLVLERLLDFLGIETLGDHEWFPLLALHALQFQQADGGWYAWRGDRLVPTALFVLFVSRTQTSYLGGELPTYTPGPTPTGKAARLPRAEEYLVERKDGTYVRLAELLASLEVAATAERRRLAEKGLERAGPALRGDFVPALVGVFERGGTRARSWAARALRRITGLKGRDPEAWRQWYRESRGK